MASLPNLPLRVPLRPPSPWRRRSGEAQLPWIPGVDRRTAIVGCGIYRNGRRVPGDYGWNEAIEAKLRNTLVAANPDQAGVQQDEDMREISAWVAIASVPTAVAGIYGMNFEHMPELTWTYSYPVVIALIVLVCVVLHHSFKRNGWL